MLGEGLKHITKGLLDAIGPKNVMIIAIIIGIIVALKIFSWFRGGDHHGYGGHGFNLVLGSILTRVFLFASKIFF